MPFRCGLGGGARKDPRALPTRCPRPHRALWRPVRSHLVSGPRGCGGPGFPRLAPDPRLRSARGRHPRARPQGPASRSTVRSPSSLAAVGYRRAGHRPAGVVGPRIRSSAGCRARLRGDAARALERGADARAGRPGFRRARSRQAPFAGSQSGRLEAFRSRRRRLLGSGGPYPFGRERWARRLQACCSRRHARRRTASLPRREPRVSWFMGISATRTSCEASVRIGWRSILALVSGTPNWRFPSCSGPA